nr:sialin-like [Onthophagus taurus]
MSKININKLIPTRAVIGTMIFMACFMCYVVRVNMSINLIAMVEPIGSKTGHQVAECSRNDEENENQTESLQKLTSTVNYGARYSWNGEIQGLILGSYFWGYILTSIPGGLLAERFGPVKTIGVSTILSAALTLLVPLCASWHYIFVITARFLTGMLGGVVYPGLHCLISRWAPPIEKGKFTGALLGGTLGTVITWPLLGAILESMGWSWAFFIPGIIVLLWCTLWFILVSDTPEDHPRISEEEKKYIAKSVGDVITKEKALPPYKDMFLSIPFWAYTVLHFGNLWGLYLLLTAGPKFMSEVLGFNLGHSGILASLPYLARMLLGFLFGYIGDYIRKKSWMSVTVIRKSFVLFSHFIPGIFLIAQTFTGCDTTLAVIFLTLALGMNGASTLTNLQNSQDLAPNFAGTLYGVVNCIGGTTGFITPMLTGYFTKEHNGLDEWHIIFWIGASVYIGSGVVFCLLGSGQIQPWNYVKCIPPQKSGVDNPAFAENDAKEDNTKV